MSSRVKKCVWHVHGQQGVGKSTFINNFPSDGLSEDFEEGIRKIKNRFVMDNGTTLDMEIFEIAPTCKFSFLDQGSSLEENIDAFFKSATCSMYVFDNTSKESYHSRDKWDKSFSRDEGETSVVRWLIGNNKGEDNVGEIFDPDVMYFETTANDKLKVGDLFIMLCEITVLHLQQLGIRNKGIRGLNFSSDDEEEEEEEEEGEEEEIESKPEISVNEHVKGFKNYKHLTNKLTLLGKRDKYRRIKEVVDKLANFKVVLKNKVVYLLKPYLVQSPLYSEHFDNTNEYLGLSDVELNINSSKANEILVFFEEKDIDKLRLKPSEFCDYFILFHSLQIFGKCFILADNIYSMDNRIAYKQFFHLVEQYENDQIKNLFLQTSVLRVDEMMRELRIRRYEPKTSYTFALLDVMDCGGFETLQRIVRKRARKKPILLEKYKYLDSIIFHLNFLDENNDDRELRDHRDYLSLPIDTYDDFDFEKIRKNMFKSFIKDGVASDLQVFPNDYNDDSEQQQQQEEEEEEDNSDDEEAKRNKKMKPQSFKLHKCVLGFKSEFFMNEVMKDPSLEKMTVDLSTKSLFLLISYCYEREEVFDDDEDEYCPVGTKNVLELIRFSVKHRDYKLLYTMIDFLDSRIQDDVDDVDIMILYPYGEEILNNDNEDDKELLLKYLLPVFMGSSRRSKKSAGWVLKKLEKGKRMEEERRLLKEMKDKVKMLELMVEEQNKKILENERVSNLLNEGIKRLDN